MAARYANNCRGSRARGRAAWVHPSRDPTLLTHSTRDPSNRDAEIAGDVVAIHLVGDELYCGRRLGPRGHADRHVPPREVIALPVRTRANADAVHDHAVRRESLLSPEQWDAP